MKSRVEAVRPAQAKTTALFGMTMVFAAGLLLSACNTTAGAGADLSAAGRGVSKAATDTKDKL